jgi:uncharacterized membrane protein YecN with MAPEG domain
MPGFDWTTLASLMGLALVVVGFGILRAYRRIVPYHKGVEGLPANPPPMLIGIFMNFVRAACACLVMGVALLVLAHVMGPGLTSTASLPLNIPISLYFAGVLGLLLVVLTYNVLYHRVRAAIEAEGGTDELAERIVRVQGNFTEYVPTGLALMLALEWSGAPDAYVFIGGGLFTIARILHAWGLTTNAMASFGRVVGIQTTLGSLAFMAISAVYFILVAA